MKEIVIGLIFSLFCGLNLFGNDNNFTNKFDHYIEDNELYQKGCDNGDSKACFNLGDNYFEGLGVKQSFPKANEFYKKACDGENVNGCFKLANYYKEKDYFKAIKLYKKACDGENANSCYNLGIFYKDGLYDVNQDTKKAKEFLSKACKLGNQIACDIYPNLNKQ